MDINADDQNVKSPVGNSKNIARRYSSRLEMEMILHMMCSWNLHLTPESRDIAEVLDDPQLCVRCMLHASPDEREEKYMRLFVFSLRREDPILDAYLHEDGADGAAGDEEPDDIFEQVQEDDPIRSPVAHDEHDAGQSSPAAAPHVPLRKSVNT
ncbi:hypothetical protein Fot_07785 [Forsythia ovata]|uniref:Uncharacterized protein n=1 Tax=Forsythia ovata TaxID=205694 RepID=A0ABD1WX52_9LAMI